MSEALAPCPRCGKPEGKSRDVGRGRFRFYVICGGVQLHDRIRTHAGHCGEALERGEAGKGEAGTKRAPRRQADRFVRMTSP